MTDATCNRCHKEMTLPDVDESGESIDVSKLSPKMQGILSKFAKLLVCDECAQILDSEDEQRQQQAGIARLATRSGLPESLRALEWGDMVRTGERKVAIAAAIQWATCPPAQARGLYLWGDTGTGKTRLAATAAWERLKRGMPLRWISVAVLLSRLESSFSDGERQNALGVLLGDGPVVLDDIDKLNATDSKRAQLFGAIDRRVTAGAPILITGNLSPAKLEEKLGDAIASRLLGYALGRTFRMDGPDRRMTLDDA